MNKQQLVDATKDYLRLSVACTLKISLDEYESSIDTQTAVNRYLTNVMCLGYNPRFVDALKEAIEFRFSGDTPTSEEFDKLANELKATQNTLQKEIAAYSYIHKIFESEVSIVTILHHIKSIAPLTREYGKAQRDTPVNH